MITAWDGCVNDKTQGNIELSKKINKIETGMCTLVFDYKPQYNLTSATIDRQFNIVIRPLSGCTNTEFSYRILTGKAGKILQFFDFW